MTLNTHIRLFLLLVAFSLTTAICVIAFQYSREKEYKAQLLDTRLQAINREIADTDPDTAINDLITRSGLDHLRVTIIGTDGVVRFDNMAPADSTIHSHNHLGRPEVAQAMKTGQGYCVMRHSQSTDDVYFYSATRIGDHIVRSAVPYSVSLANILAADRGFLWFMVAITALMIIIAWFTTRHIGHTVTRLNDFARRAEHGESIFDDEAFPKDELGEISKHIIRLYVQRERQHKAALAQERDKIRIKKQLTNNINHELKTPLAAMQVCLETLLSHPELPTDKKDMFIRRCHDNSLRLAELLADVSTLTRLDDGKDMISREDISLRRIISDAAAEFSAPGCLSIDIDMPDNMTIHGNASLLSAIFCNLIRNANAYSQGTEIHISASIVENTAHITFSDDGVGIPPEHLPHIFERFYRVDKGRSRANGGTGLGLAIVKNAVIFHGGSIFATNNSTGGLRFDITLPVVP